MNERIENPWYSMSDEELEAELAELDMLEDWKKELQTETLRKEKEARGILTDLYRTLCNVTPSFTSNDLRL